MATKQSVEVARGDGPRDIHAGLQTAYGYYTAGGVTLSAGDVIQMVKVPNGAVIVHRAISGVAGAAAVGLNIGDGGDGDRYGHVTLSATAHYHIGNAAAGHGYQYSLSDDATVRYDTVDLTIDSVSSATATCSIVLTVTYYMAPKSA